MNSELGLAQARIDQAERKAEASRTALAAAEEERNRAQTDASRASADATLAQQRIETARSEAAAASERAVAAEQRAVAAQKNCTRCICRGQAPSTENRTRVSGCGGCEARKCGLELRPQKAKAQRLEAERALLAQQLGQLETQRMTSSGSDVRNDLGADQLDQALTDARIQQDQKNTALLSAERQAKDAEAQGGAGE